MELIQKTGFGFVLILMLILLGAKLIIPTTSMWVVISPIALLTAIMIFGWLIEALFEVFKIALKLGVIIVLVYLFTKLFL